MMLWKFLRTVCGNTDIATLERILKAGPLISLDYSREFSIVILTFNVEEFPINKNILAYDLNNFASSCPIDVSIFSLADLKKYECFKSCRNDTK